MADSSLDDFFAKKDKNKKNKQKSKFTTTDTIAKKLEEGGKKEYVKKESREKISVSSSNSPSAPTANEQEDDEWKNIDDNQERDYSGLKVQSLSVSDKEKEEEQLKEQMAEQNDEISRAGDGQNGPWKVVTSAVPVVIEKEETEEKEERSESPEKEIVEIAKPAAYKPPALRSSASNSPNSAGSSRRHPKSTPELNSELDFPSLSAAAKGKQNNEGDKSFQSVKHGVKSKADTPSGLQLDLENKFSALHLRGDGAGEQGE